MHPGGMVQSPEIQNLLKLTLMNYEANPSISMDTISQERIYRLHLIHNKKLITNNLRAMKAKMLFGNISLHNMMVLVNHKHQTTHTASLISMFNRNLVTSN